MSSAGKLAAADGKPIKTIGNYSLIAELARGGMGRVYLARRAGEAGFERLFAIKVMHHHMADNPEAVLMVLDEAHIASRLHHPNVVSVSDIGTYEGGYYLVMDYVEGCSFNELLAKNTEKRDPRLIAPIMIDAMQGLHAAHMLKDTDGTPFNVVHRDISPHNLMVGLDGTCRVTDFGIAKASARFSGQTEVGTRKGKLAYMPPEQIVGDTDVDRRADIWACGVTFYYALTAKHPFRAPTEPQTIHNVIAKQIQRPSEVSAMAPVCFDDVVMKALDRDPEKRWATAREMGDAIRAIALDEKLLGSPSDVASWVESTFGEQIAERRRGIGSVKQRGAISSSLPVLQPFTMTPSAEIALPTDVGGVMVDVDVDPTTHHKQRVSITPQAVDITPPPDRKKLALIGGGLLGFAVVVAIILAVALPSGDETDEASASHPPTEEVTAPVVDPEPAVEEAAPEPAAPIAPVVAAPAPEVAPSEPAEEETRRPRPRPRPASARAPSEPAAQTASPEPAPTAQPAATQPPAAQPTRSLERNPYLRRE